MKYVTAAAKTRYFINRKNNKLNVDREIYFNSCNSCHKLYIGEISRNYSKNYMNTKAIFIKSI